MRHAAVCAAACTVCALLAAALPAETEAAGSRETSPVYAGAEASQESFFSVFIPKIFVFLPDGTVSVSSVGAEGDIAGSEEIYAAPDGSAVLTDADGLGCGTAEVTPGEAVFGCGEAACGNRTGTECICTAASGKHTGMRGTAVFRTGIRTAQKN